MINVLCRGLNWDAVPRKGGRVLKNEEHTHTHRAGRGKRQSNRSVPQQIFECQDCEGQGCCNSNSPTYCVCLHFFDTRNNNNNNNLSWLASIVARDPYRVHVG